MKFILVTLITASRVPLALLSCWQMLAQQWDAAWIFFLLCVATDVIDGWLARRWDTVCGFGVMFDLISDIAIFWLFVPATYWYSQVYGAWWQENCSPRILIAALCVVAAVLVIASLFMWGQRLLCWWREKGNFWCGVIPVAAIGGWISWQAGWWALAATIAYGVATCYINREKVKNFL